MKKDKYIQFKEGIHPEDLERKGFAHDVELKSGEGEGDGILQIKFYAIAFGNIDS